MLQYPFAFPSTTVFVTGCLISVFVYLANKKTKVVDLLFLTAVVSTNLAMGLLYIYTLMTLGLDYATVFYFVYAPLYLSIIYS
jgi:hypothetical protein